MTGMRAQIFGKWTQLGEFVLLATRQESDEDPTIPRNLWHRARLFSSPI